LSESASRDRARSTSAYGGRRLRRAHRVIEPALVVAVFAVLTLLALPGLFGRRSSHLPADLGDPVLNLYFLAWGARQFELGFPDYWDANFFFPNRSTMALSDHLIGPAALAWLLSKAGAGAVATYNLLFAASFVLAGLSAHWLFRRCGLAQAPALVAAAGYAFSHFRWLHLNHLQLLWAPCLPLALGAFDLLLERPTSRRALLFVVLYAAHLTGGTYLAFMIHLPLAAILLARSPDLVRARRPADLARLGATAIACAGLAWLAFEPYRRAAELHRLVRPESDLATWGATLLALVTPSRTSWYFPESLEALYRSENALFPGFVVATFALAIAVRAARAGRLPRERWRRAALAVGVATFAAGLALGDYRTWTGAERWQWAGLSIHLHHYARPARLVAGGLLLAGLALLRRGPRPLRAPRRRRRAALGWASAAALLACFPVVFTPLARALPGFDAMRVPARFFVFASLGICLAAGAGLAFLLRRLAPRHRPLAAAVALALLAVDLRPARLPWAPLPEGGAIPEIYRRIAARPEVTALIELPLPRFEEISVEALRMFYSTAHWRPIANGMSGHFPDSYLRLRARLLFPPSDANLAELPRMGISHALLDLGRPPRRGRRDPIRHWLRAGEEAGRFRVVDSSGARILLALGSASALTGAPESRREPSR
jgi:hypothetical protein